MGIAFTPGSGALVGRVRCGVALLSSLLLPACMPFGTASSQAASIESLAEQSSVIVRGRVLRLNASDDPLVSPSGRTAVIRVLQMYAGSEIAGDQKGRNATVILSRSEAVRPNEEALFFGNVRSLGNSMTIADQQEIVGRAGDTTASPALARGIQARKDRPIRERLAVATLVFRGLVESVQPLEAGVEERRGQEAGTEHDPEWRAARVRIITPLRGGQAGQIVTIVFPASRDIVWFNSPKLTPGQDAVFLAHIPSRDEQNQLRTTRLAALMQGQPVYLVTEPYDVLPPTTEPRIYTMLPTAKEE